MIFFMFFVGSLLPSISFGCAIRAAPLEERVRCADVIFVGEIEEIRKMKKPKKYINREIVVGKVKEIYKGNLPGGKVSIFFRQSEGEGMAACRPGMANFPISKKVKGDLLLFARYESGILFTESVYRSGPADEWDIKQDLENIPELAKRGEKCQLESTIFAPYFKLRSSASRDEKSGFGDQKK